MGGKLEERLEVVDEHARLDQAPGACGNGVHPGAELLHCERGRQRRRRRYPAAVEEHDQSAEGDDRAEKASRAAEQCDLQAAVEERAELTKPVVGQRRVPPVQEFAGPEDADLLRGVALGEQLHQVLALAPVGGEAVLEGVRPPCC